MEGEVQGRGGGVDGEAEGLIEGTWEKITFLYLTYDDEDSAEMEVSENMVSILMLIC